MLYGREIEYVVFYGNLVVFFGVNDDCVFEGIVDDDDDNEGSIIDGEREYNVEDYNIDNIFNKG